MPINLERRKAVMARSIKLGHCVCEPAKPCPCDTFKEQNVCTCAGEKLPKRQGPIALTQFVRKAGCASKIGQADLLRVLGALPAVTDPNVLVGTAAGDDAGVYRMEEGPCLVQTVDLFTPCVDDPYLFGQIAAANSLSDCYAMGARPLTALSVVCFPIDTADEALLIEMLRGAIDKLNEAGCSLVGGHSVNDEEIKCGFAITGSVDAAAAVERNRAQPGDLLVLTKPLGTGMVAFAAQLGFANEACLREVGGAMATLNRDAAELMVRYGAHAATDITGFGLAGHLVEMTRGSGVWAEIDMSAVPIFGAAAACMEHDLIGGAVERNQEYARSRVRSRNGVDATGLPILYDPQTSGGLLIALPENEAGELVEEMHRRGHAAAQIIGRIIEPPEGEEPGKVVVINATLANWIGAREGAICIERMQKAAPTAPRATAVSPPANDMPDCCAQPPGVAADADAPYCESPPIFDAEEETREALESSRAPAKFADFMKEANRPGRIDARGKKLMAIALSVAQHCEPCLKIHLRGAESMGLAKAEIDEAAWMAIAFAGAPALMFYNAVCAELGMS